MSDALNRNIYLVKEEPKLLGGEFNCDMMDPQSGELLLACRERKPGRLTRLFRFSDFKRTTPFDIRVSDPTGKQLLRIVRGVPVCFSRVRVYDESDVLIGIFRQRMFTFSGAFDVLDAAENPVCHLRGGLMGWSFRFLTPDGTELAHVTKRWAGLGQELFTSADDYMLQIDDAVPPNSTIRHLILASVLCVGIVVKVELL